MKREAWARKMKSKKNPYYITLGVDGNCIVASEIESISPVWIRVRRTNKDKVNMIFTIFMKSGQEIEVEKDFDAIYETEKIWFNLREKKTYMKADEYWKLINSKNTKVLDMVTFNQDRQILVRDLVNHINRGAR